MDIIKSFSREHQVDKNTLIIDSGCSCIETGSVPNLDGVLRVIIPETVTEIRDGAFDRACKLNFWVVKGSLSAFRIAELCPDSSLILFDTQESMDFYWKHPKERRSWRAVRKAVTKNDVFKIATLSGWTYDESRTRAEKAFIQSGVTAKQYAKQGFKQWLKSAASGTPNSSWAQFREQQVSILQQSLNGSATPVYDLDHNGMIPEKVSARRYAGKINLAKQIREHAITLRVLCDYLCVDVPEELEEKQDTVFPNIIFARTNLSRGNVYFCWRDKNLRPKDAKLAGVMCTIGLPKYREAFEEAGVPFISCDNLNIHMFEIAALWRKQFPQAKTVCITGSIGKTTTTEMVNHVAQAGFKSLCIWINKNLPIQASWHTQSLDDETGVYVQEASGASVGELEKTSAILEPDMFIITNVGTSHIGNYGGNRTSLLYEKTAPDRRAAPGALGIINYDDELLRSVKFLHDVVWFSINSPEADYHAEDIVEEDGVISFEVVEKSGERTPVKVHAFGTHNILDALSAFAVGVRLGMERSVIAAAIANYRSRGIRQNLLEIAGRRVFLDCYNASEDSMKATLKTAGMLKVPAGAKRIAVLGDMLELGVKSAEIHRNVGKAIHDCENLDEVILYGPEMRSAIEPATGGKAVIRHTESRTELESWLKEIPRDDVVLMKSSHGMELQRVSDDWLGTAFYIEELTLGYYIHPSSVKKSVVGRIEYTSIGEYGTCVTKSTVLKTKITLPSEVNGMPLRLIFDKVFAGSSISEITMPAPLFSVGKDAFSGCHSLKKVVFPGTLYHLDVGAFRDCTALEQVDIPFGCATIGGSAFAGCKALKRVSLPSSVLTIGEQAFDEDCTAVFEIAKNAEYADTIRAMCPHAQILLKDEAPTGKIGVPTVDFNQYVPTETPAETVQPEKTTAAEPVKETQSVMSAALLASVKAEQPRKTAAANNSQSHRTQIVVTAAGDCTLGKNHKIPDKNSWGEFFAAKGPAYFLSKTAPVFKESDLAIVNLEGVLSDITERSAAFFNQRAETKVSDKVYSHIGKPEYIKALTEGGINAVSFANNHNIDYGVKAFADTVHVCEEHELPIAYYDRVIRYQVDDLTVGIFSIDFTYCSDSIGKGYMRKCLSDLRRDCDLIIACLHWGGNYKENPTPAQRKLGHLCIDLGADMVLGCHAHILQGVERYKGRYIYYSLGNFCYGGRSAPKDNDTMIVRQTFTFKDKKLRVDDNVELIPCWMSGSAKVNDFCPEIKDGEAKKCILDKVNERSADFGMKFDGNGKPVVESAKDAKRVIREDPYDECVPSIVYTQLDKG